MDYLKPLLIILFCGLAYSLTLVAGFSNILAVIVYGLTQSRYTVFNMRSEPSCPTSSPSPSSTKASYISNEIVKTCALVSKTLLFFLLGTQFKPESLGEQNVWTFTVAVLLLTTLARWDILLFLQPLAQVPSHVWTL